MTEFDVIIIGAGPAGAGAGIELAARGARVLVAEQKRFPREKLCGEFISPECLGHFERLGVLGAMREARGADVSETVFYAASGRGVRVPSEWFAGAGGAAALGLSRAEMDARLLGRAREAGARVFEEATPAGVLIEKGVVRGVRLQEEGGGVSEYRAHVTIDATGRARAVARKAARGLGGERRGNGAKARRAPLVAFKAHMEGAAGAEGPVRYIFIRAATAA